MESLCQRSFDASFQCRICTIFSPLSLSGTTIIYCLYFYSFSILFRDYPATILNVTVWSLSLLYLFPFCFTCSFFIPKREQPSHLVCVFFIYLVSFYAQNLFQKRHNPCFLVLSLSVLLFCDCSNCTFLRFFSEHGPVMVLF